ncbi:hypothetical protein BJ684DRAFT_15042 [Piptocephalis cylindrospora]|uniref:Uncharacterized protein n=1 Tax=Piptocephalis cylindrospora TaxID=1907219 RepID=A0A4P9Y7E8_9FUNG|nr:hypothetical protein BJ684DRAFT_15042 [Piptocephalis cylindrospora]|eukprot:RKP14654.1 hypothetical protein BJ684DRAFT_15042 [Piptocephalis cylindrospora]
MPWFLESPSSSAKRVKTQLDLFGWRDKQGQIVKVASSTSQARVAFPLEGPSSPDLSSALPGSEEGTKGVSDAILSLLSQDLQDLGRAGDLLVTWRSPSPLQVTQEGNAGRIRLARKGEVPRSTIQRLFAQSIREVEPRLEEEIIQTQIQGIPERWELYQDFALLSPTAFLNPPIDERFQPLAITWISRVLGVGHLARKSAIPKDDPLRRPRLIPLLGTFSHIPPSSLAGMARVCIHAINETPSKILGYSFIYDTHLLFIPPPTLYIGHPMPNTRRPPFDPFKPSYLDPPSCRGGVSMLQMTL